MSELKHILVVDDDANNVELIRAALAARNFPFETVVANDGEEGLDYLHGRGKFLGRNHGPPAVVLLDLKMPRADGFEVLAQMKSDERLKTIPVVVFTSSDDAGDRLRSYELGANAYVVKPVDFTKFAEAIMAIGAFWTVVNAPPPILGERAAAPAEAAAA